MYDPYELCELYDMYDVVHAAGWYSCNLHGLGHGFLGRTGTACTNAAQHLLMVG